MKQNTCKGVISVREEFFYPDMELMPLPNKIQVVMPKNGLPGISLLLQTKADALEVELESELFEGDFFCMQAVPVEYNTGDGSEQGGAMVLEQKPLQKPGYATRPAPFLVYDCLRPIENKTLETRDGLAAVYVCLIPRENITAGVHTALLKVGDYSCIIEIRVYDVEIQTDTFPITNWFSLNAICQFHCLEKDTPVFYEMVRLYARAMRRIHQTIFYIELDDACVKERAPYSFDFEYLTPLIQVFFEEGMQYMELGALLSRGFLPEGEPDMYTDSFKCSMAPQIPIDTPEGYAVTVKFVQALAEFLQRNGWQDKVLFHIHDEPDIHFKEDAVLQARKRQYYLAASILRKYLPKVRIIEAVASPEFRGGVDIWVPGTPGFEENKEEFDRLIELGEQVWAYVCCGPEGYWLNRFLDFALLKGRLLFWGYAKNRLGGFLHWGFNQFQMGMNPFEGTSCPNHTGIGTNFPCGDSFIVYPGTDGPWLGMRMEAARRGAEDAALLKQLLKVNPEAHDRLVEKVFRSNTDYDDNPEVFENVYEELLILLERR